MLPSFAAAAYGDDAAAGASAAPAQPASPAVETDTGAITVTARRRTESITDVPLAISVVTAAKLQKLDIKSTSELANYVPGLQFSDYTPGYARNDRGATRPLIFRGLNLGTGGSVTAAGGMFLDGAAVVGNEIPASMDIGQVEVLRGPQSVYFGRSTMTGAVSYRTKAIPDHLTASFEAEGGERGLRNFEGSVAGPVIADLLRARVSGVLQHTDGYATNAYDPSSPKLGERDRKSISGTIELTPASNLDIKGYVNYFHDHDGEAATAFVTNNYDNCTRPGATRTTFCGQIPGGSAITYYQKTNVPTTGDFQRIFDTPLIDGQGFKKDTGLQRNSFNSHVIVNWQLSDYLKLNSITGYHTNVTLQVADGQAQPYIPGSTTYSNYFYSITNKTKDFSQELRLSSDPARRLSWTLGGNYIFAYNKTSAITVFQTTAQNAAGTSLPASPANLTTDEAHTKGIFGGAYFKIVPKLVLSAEARYQWDKRETLSNSLIRTTDGYDYGPIVSPPNDKTYGSFNPRIALDYDIGGGRKVYTSYASGTRPGGFNALLATYKTSPQYAGNAALQSQLTSLLPINNPNYAEEKLRIGELGIKGDFDGRKGFFDINGYYGKVTNQQITYGALIPALLVSVTAIANIGKAEVYGVEAQGNYNFTHEFSLSGTFSWNHTKRTQFTDVPDVAQFGTTDLAGTSFAYTPQFSGSAIASYERPINDMWSAYINSAYVYRGKIYTDVGNLSWIKGRSQVDLRTGLSSRRYTLELFMTNVFNNRQYTNGSVAPDYGQTGSRTYYAFFGAQAEPRTFGGRINVNF